MLGICPFRKKVNQSWPKTRTVVQIVQNITLMNIFDPL